MATGARSSIISKWFKGGDLAFYNSLYLTLTKFTQLSASLLYTRIYEYYDSLFQPILIGAIIDLKEFDLFYWTVILAFGINFGIFYPFVGNSTTIYKEKFCLTSKNTGDIQSINYFMGLFCPLVGLLIKKYKRFQFFLLIIATSCSLLFFCILYFHPGCEEACFNQLIVPVLIFGIFLMAFPVVLVPAVANASPSKLAGTAYGIAYAFRNFNEALIPYIGVGPLLSNYTVNATIMLFIGLSIFSLVISIVLHDEAKVNNILQSEYEQTTDGESLIISEKQISLEQNGDLLKIQQIIQKYRDRKIIKYLFLIGIFSSGLMFYNNNFQGILKEYILEDTGIDQQQFQLFQTLSTGPIIPLILFSGAVNDILGLRNGMSFYFFMMAIGMWIATIGGYNNSFVYLLIGKILNNAGIEMGIGARSSITAKWFKGGDLAFYNSIYLTITKFTQFSASLLYTRIYEHYDSLFQPILIGAIIGTTCFLVNLCSFFTDLNADKQITKLDELEPKKHVKSFSLKDLKEFDLFYWTIILAFGINFGIYYPFVGNSTTIYKDNHKNRVIFWFAGDLI
ncbi:Major facilitator superfamily domain, general substrate transporter [Pseudocohnilembus persalinus]|uniref:Lysosomal dipeptide transporter MFSD1 n=1 Tax=Pseudocohnilembus persalinus TaxID=266149 RepID=A0A0V0QJ84_PSEPJ|nr:Major facilitator superfamily domain, general substrate transporter [Pseudocohnilembus persalinus]|eukprot:KRX02263.1 Major facilitator superfamily domain, general substrate transporter [Pseudocohnilembus persalinus]